LLTSTIGPATPEGLVVGTPKSDMEAVDSNTAEMPIDRPLGLAETRMALYNLAYMNITYEDMETNGKK
jgi:hypothetical protein